MKNDVISHVFVSQTLVGVLVGIALDLTAADYESGEVLTGSLKQCVFFRQGVLHHLGESGVHFDHALGVLDSQLAFCVHNCAPFLV